MKSSFPKVAAANIRHNIFSLAQYEVKRETGYSRRHVLLTFLFDTWNTKVKALLARILFIFSFI